MTVDECLANKKEMSFAKCPHCGSEWIYMKRWYEQKEKNTTNKLNTDFTEKYYVQCDKCLTRTEICDMLSEATIQWNMGNIIEWNIWDKK